MTGLRSENLEQFVGQWEKWRETIQTLDVSKLVFLDESGVNIALTRRYGCVIWKEHVHNYTPLNTPKSTTMLSSIRMDGTMIHKEFSGAVNREHFMDYVTNSLTPSLHSGDIVIMDNLRTHKVDGVQQTIQSVGAQVLYLPPYSPDFNPIEMLWSKIKSILRKWKARTLSQLHSSIPKAYSLISLSDIFAWFRETGYLHS